MKKLVTATLSSKGQLTLPKEVRTRLGIREKGEMIGFVIDDTSRDVHLLPVEVVPVDEDFSEEEYQKLHKLAKQRGEKTFSTLQALLSDLKKAK